MTEATETPVDGEETFEEAEYGGEGQVDEGDIAADYLEELLDIADIDGDIDILYRLSDFPASKDLEADRKHHPFVVLLVACDYDGVQLQSLHG